MNHNFKDITGQKFGRLMVISYSHSDRSGYACYKCTCGCGKEIICRAANLRSGTTRSCGCFLKDYLRENKKGQKYGYKHGYSPSKKMRAEYKAWAAMIQRCTNPNCKAYKYYGARGIKVCDRWRNNFINFISDMGDRPPGLTLDRINNDGDYEPGNCRWATRGVQSSNKRRRYTVQQTTLRTKLSYLGINLPIAAWTRMSGIPDSTLRRWLKQGKTLEDCFRRHGGFRVHVN